MGLENFTDILVGFTKTADPQVVIVVLVFTFVLLRAIWLPHGYSRGTIVLASLIIAIPVTHTFSAAEEIAWGERYFWRAVLQNSAVSAVAWFFIMPQVFRKWPWLLRDEEDPPKAEPSVPDVATRRAAEQKTRRTEFGDP